MFNHETSVIKPACSCRELNETRDFSSWILPRPKLSKLKPSRQMQIPDYVHTSFWHVPFCWRKKMMFHQTETYWCVLRREFSGRIHFITIVIIIPATPSPSIPYYAPVTETWKIWKFEAGDLSADPQDLLVYRISLRDDRIFPCPKLCSAIDIFPFIHLYIYIHTVIWIKLYVYIYMYTLCEN